MSVHTVAYQPRVLGDLVPGAAVRDAALVVSGAGLIGLAAQIQLHTPLSPVPFTLQTAAVVLLGAVLGSKRGVLTALLYIGAGAAGVPWFADGGSGWSAPSFGYTLGFVLAMLVTGALAERGADRRFGGTLLTLVAGSLAIYVPGTLWLAEALSVPLDRALELGVQPFVLADLVKCLVAAAALPALWKLASRRTP